MTGTPSPEVLAAQLENVIQKLDELRSVVITRDLFSGTVDRITRLEQDQKDSERFSAQATAEAEKRLQDQITKLSSRLDASQKAIEQAGKARVNLVIIGALNVAATIVAHYLLPNIP